MTTTRDPSPMERCEAFLAILETRLGIADDRRRRSIVDEVRADFMAQVESHLEAGKDEGEAVDLTLESLGDPEALALSIRETVPPLSHGPKRVVRYVVAIGLIGWTIMLLWTFRAWTHGISSIGIVPVLAFHLALILTAWPTIVWRRNSFHGAVPLAVCLAGFLVASLAGKKTESSEYFTIPEDGVAVSATDTATEVDAAPARIDRRWFLWTAGIVIATGAAALLLSMQQARQRRVVIIATLLTAGGIELLFGLEERRFHRLCEDLEQAVPGAADADAFKAKALELGATHAWLHEDGQNFSVLWNRPLNSGFALGYSSEWGRVWVND